MPLAYTALIDAIEIRVRDETNTNFATTELDEELKDALINVSGWFPHERPETYTIESRVGTATSTSSGNLVDCNGENVTNHAPFTPYPFRVFN